MSDAFIDREDELARERGKMFVGSASVRLEAFKFSRKADNTNVERLLALLGDANCDRTDVKNHVVATIDTHTLERALQESSLTSLATDASGAYPKLELPLGMSILCLDGVDRLTAAREIFPHDEQHWVADLYLAGTL